MTLQYHPLANIFPLIEGAEFDEFCTNLKASGRLHDKIVMLDGQILDGRNRYRGCGVTGITAHYRNFDPEAEGDPQAFVLAKNLARRHLNESQRAMVAARLATMRQGERTDMQHSANLQKVDAPQAADRLNVSARSVASAAKVQAKATAEVQKAVDQGHLPVSTAEKLADLPAEVQREIVGRVPDHHLAAAASAEIKKVARAWREDALAQKQAALPDKRYGVIYADPEWRFEVYSRDTGMDRAADNHYPTTATDAICRRPVGEIAADDCVLYLWGTAPMTPDALSVMKAWGFDYKSQVIWKKDRVGTGYWFRNQHEILFVGTRGHVPAPAMGTQIPSVIDAPVGKHSEKPDVFYELIETYFPNLPKIELNARRARAGWDSWGNEAPEKPVASSKLASLEEAGEVIEHTEPSQSSESSSGVAPQSEASHAGTGSEMSAGCEGDQKAGAQMLPPPIEDDDDGIPAFLRRAANPAPSEPSGNPADGMSVTMES